MQLNAYLHFNGNCEAAFRFYEKVLGGKVDRLILHEGTPAEQHTPPEWRKKVMHGRLSVQGQTVMGSDVPPDHYQQPQGFSVTLTIPDRDEAERTFQALSAEGKVSMAFQETFWAKGFGMAVDRFGIPWMINCEKPVPVPEPELEHVHSA